MKAILLSTFLMLSVPCCFAEGADLAARDDKVGQFGSLADLIATPERYDGRLVFVTGYVSVEFENHSLCPNKDLLSEDCIWISLYHAPVDGSGESRAKESERFYARLERFKPFHGQKISIRGIFNSRNTGHFGLFSGAIERIMDAYSAETHIKFYDLNDEK
jgi:hypothetical protein